MSERSGDIGQGPDAESGLLRLLECEPDNVELLFNLGRLRLERGDPVGAREALLHAHVLVPKSAAVRICAAKALCQCRDDRAAQLIADWRDWLPLPEQQQYVLADVMQLTDWSEESVGVLEDLLARSPQHRWAKLLLAALYERTNRLADAETLIADLLAEEPCDANVRREALHQQATLLMRAGGLSEARAVLESAGARFADDVEYFFALAGLADGLGDQAAAMRVLASAHAIQVRELERVAPQRLRAGAPILPAAASSLDADDFARWPDLHAPDAKQSPVFVVGFPRSGTTLVEQMLDAHPALQSMDERPLFNNLNDQLEEFGVRVPQDLHKLTQADCNELRKGYMVMACAKIERNWQAQLVDKNPMNMLWLPLLYRMFPHARIVRVLRHPCDVLISNYMQNYRSPVTIAMSTSLERLAQAYAIAMRHWQHHFTMLKPSVLVLRYEDLVADPEAQVARLGDYLGLQDPAPMLQFHQHARSKRFIGTPSYTQVLEPIHRQRIGRWLRYRTYLEDVLPILAPVCAELGYSLDSTT